MTAHPFVSVGLLPACDQLGCRFDVRSAATAIDPDGRIVSYDARAANGDALFAHVPPTGARAEYRIPREWLDDSTKDIWAALQRWALRLHEEGADVAPR